MKRIAWIAPAGVLLLLFVFLAAFAGRKTFAKLSTASASMSVEAAQPPATENGFSVEVLIYGRPATEYSARGRRYIEALQNAEYELRIHNPSGGRVAVALSVDGMNTIDARHTSAWDAHKWVIDPYETI